MGLNYLQKKNWHPGSIKNQEIVWIREQLQAEIIKREQERAKKLAEEKNIEELKRIQVEAGLIPKSHLDRMEWMYDVGRLEQQQKTTEEYLLGKPITPEEAEKLAQQRDKKNGIQPQYQTIFKEETTNAKCEDFVKVHEDPLFKIMQGEMQIKQQFYENPLKMKQILDEDCKNKANKKSKKEKKDKKDKKEKKSKKEKKNKNSSRSRSRSSDVNTSSTSLYNSYIQQRLGGIAIKDTDGNIKADFGLMKKKYRNNLSKDADVNELRKQMEVEGQNRIKQQANQQFDNPQPQQKTGQFLNQIRNEIYNQNDSQAKYDRIQRNRNHHEKHRD